jgi:hypothetical protein
VLNIICASKREKVKAEWRELYEEEINNLHTSSNIIRVRG